MSTYQSPLLTRKAAAKYLNMSASSLDRRVRNKEIPARVSGRIVRFKKEDLDTFIDSTYRVGFVTSVFG